MQLSDVVSTKSSGLGGSLPTAKTAEANLGKQDFMQLLVTQLRHQNPLEPMDNKDFIAQLAQFSSLEQLESMNQSLNASLTTQNTLGMATAVSYLGKNVEAEGNSVSLADGQAAVLKYDLLGAADVAIEITDVQGAVIRTLTPGAQTSGSQTVIWDGKDDRGIALPEGNYTYHVLAVGGGDRPVSVRPFFNGHVEGVRLTDEGIMLTIAGQDVPLNRIRSVRQP